MKQTIGVIIGIVLIAAFAIIAVDNSNKTNITGAATVKDYCKIYCHSNDCPDSQADNCGLLVWKDKRALKFCSELGGGVFTTLLQKTANKCSRFDRGSVFWGRSYRFSTTP